MRAIQFQIIHFSNGIKIYQSTGQLCRKCTQ